LSFCIYVSYYFLLSWRRTDMDLVIYNSLIQTWIMKLVAVGNTLVPIWKQSILNPQFWKTMVLKCQDVPTILFTIVLENHILEYITLFGYKVFLTEFHSNSFAYWDRRNCSIAKTVRKLCSRPKFPIPRENCSIAKTIVFKDVTKHHIHHIVKNTTILSKIEKILHSQIPLNHWTFTMYPVAR
jgi:hypothetical protein